MRMIGEHVVLREFRAEDISAMRQWITDNSITKWLAGVYARPQAWEQTEEYLRSLLYDNAGGYHFAIADKDKLKYIGQCDLMNMDALSRSAEMAVLLTSENIGKGYGSEAIRLLLEYGFMHCNLHRIHLNVWADNEKALRAYEKAGFVREGVLRKARFRDGEYRDTIIMAMLREEFENLR